ncbi:hypothetical protein PSEUBRA_005895 [Kalmanozyma brasiliensis GHG001]|uniref:uncharacterized protein n=1 Tax=Kalmanozyma brasiliensis (strain GHG001) TaxID=1365824 RepID=UPI0028680C7D|nr:uncharacterized protein PSEUBRA_005895 [Kalmanozyma brasiliensis GHG001]KAF6767572.1 hypothetical protein PSEUBRA_005895 [Kalmanozyma brasiliensis GHG001]
MLPILFLFTTLLLPVFVRAAPLVTADIPSTLRLATPTDMLDLNTALPIVSAHTQSTLLNMGLSSTFLGETASHRLLFPAPRFHHLAYLIPHTTHPYSELLVATAHDEGGKVHSYGWHRGSRWDMRVRRNIGIQVGDKWLLADNVPVGGFAVVRAPWADNEEKRGDYVTLGNEVPAEVMWRYDGPTRAE